MSTVNGFQVGSETLKYNYESLENYNTPNFSSSSSKAYAIGDYVMYNGKLYKCTTATTGGTWDANNWAEAILSDDVSNQKNAIDELSADSANLLDLKLASKVSASAATNLDVVDDSIRVHTSSDVAYGRVILRMQLKPNTVYVLSAQKHTVSGLGWIGYCESTDEGATYPSGINVLFARTNADDRVYIKPFTTTTGYVQFAFYCTYSTAEAGDVTFKTAMLNEGEYNGYYVPYLHAYDAEAETISNSAFTVLSNYIKAEISADDITTVSGSTNRLQNFGYMPFAAGDWISFVPGTNAQQIMLEYYGTADKTYLYSTDWLDALDTYIIPQDSFAIIKFRKADDSTIGVADYDATVTYTSKRTVHDFDALDDDAGIIRIKPSDIIQGAYNRDGSVMSSASRIRLKDFIPISVGDEIHFKPGAKAKEILLGYVNEYTSTQETSWTAVETTFVSNMTGFLMLLFRADSTNPSIDYRSYDADVVVKKQPQFYTGSEKYNGDMFRINYADAIPYPVRNSNTYSVTYQQIINKYDAIANRVSTLYSNVSDLVPKPLTITKTALQMTDSGYQMYKYTFTPAYPKKTVFVIAGTHGNEYESVYSLINMVKAIYTSEYIYPQFAEFRDNVKLIIIPVVNPYGFEHNTKLNGDGVNIYNFYNTDVDNPKEMLSIKSVFESETLDYFMDMHTDPYNYASAKGCYGYALADGSSFEPLYNVIIRFRDILYNEFNYVATYISSDKDIIVGRISNGSVGYAEGRGVPANLIEISTGYGWGGAEENGDPAVYPAFAPYGSADMVRICTDFYSNVLLTMYVHLMSEVTDLFRNIAPIENGTTASKAYTQGAYFWHDTKFCKALTTIASGATFTLGTNYQETTVAAELLAVQN